MVGQAVEEHPLLHIISVLDWTREGTQPFEHQRAEWLHVLAWVLRQMDPTQAGNTTLDYVLLGGQTILLEDLVTIRTSLHTSLVISNAGGRIGVGPFYVTMDGMLADGEALVRSLLLGRADVQRHGIRLLNIAYLAEDRQQNAQMPQILNGFGIDALLISSRHPTTPLPFRWEGADGSALLTVHYTHQSSPVEAVEMQRKAQPDGPFLWMNRLYPPNRQNLAALTPLDGLYSQQGMVDDYVVSLRAHFPDDLRPRLKGELQLEKESSRADRYSARLHQKQANAELLNQMVHGAEPLLALATTFSRTPETTIEIERALLDHTWRMLLQNQAPTISAGAISDAIQHDVEMRNAHVGDLIEHLQQTALTSLPGKIVRKTDRGISSGETWVTVWNPHGHAVRQVVAIPLRLAHKTYPNVLISPDGEELAFTWHPETQQISFRADVPAVGYAVYTLRLSAEETAEYNLPQIVTGSTIGSASGESLGLFSGRIDWSFDGETIHDLLRYQDGGDAGSVWQYSAPETDIIVTDSIVEVAQTELTPTYERLTYRSRMRLAPGLKNGNIRERGLRVLDLLTTLTYFQDQAGLHIRTQFTNNAEDHRLRALIRTGINAQHVFRDSAFLVHARPAERGVQPAHSLIAVEDQARGFAVFTRGLPESELLPEKEQATIALTLLRAVGWIDRERRIPAAGAQMPGDIQADFMLMPLAHRPQPADLLRSSQSWRAPLRAVQSSEKPPHNRYSYLALESDSVVMTALKPPQEGNGLIVRVLETAPTAQSFRLYSPGLKRAILMNLAEEGLEEYPVVQGKVELRSRPNQLTTLQLLYK